MSVKANHLHHNDQKPSPVPNSETGEVFHHSRDSDLQLDEHLIVASRLSRVMTLALDSAFARDNGFEEEDRLGLYELSHEIARHTGAAMKVHEERGQN